MPEPIANSDASRPAQPGGMNTHWLLLIVGVSAGVTLGQLGPIVQPYQIGALADGAGQTSAGAGAILAVQMTCYSLCLLAVAPFIDRLGFFRVGILGAIIAACAFLATYWSRNAYLLYLFGAFAGLGQGLVFAAASAAPAYADRPERLYGIGASVALVLYGGVMEGAPITQSIFGPMGVFLGLAIVMALVCPLLFGLGVVQATHVERREPAQWQAAIPLVVMLSLFGVGTGAIYAFAERVGHAIHIPSETVGLIFMVATVAGALGSGSAALIGLRFGRAIPLHLALVSTGIASLAIASATGLWWFAAAFLAFQIAYTFPFPYFLGSAAWLDPSGRLSTLSSGIIFLASALGTLFAGFLAQYFSYQAVGIFAFVACCSGTIAVPFIRKRPLLDCGVGAFVAPDPALAVSSIASVQSLAARE